MKKSAGAGQTPSVLDFLQRNTSAAGSLLAAVERMLEIQRELRRCLPTGLAEDCMVCGLEDGKLVLQVASASAASKMRQTLPRLNQTLIHHGWKVNAIRIRVQPKNFDAESEAYGSSKRTVVQKRGLMPASAVAQFGRLAEILEDSPLRAALEKAVRRRQTKPQDESQK